jgi:tetratricopeptide (TPR) repeat protein
MSPEQAETNQLDIDTRSDIYSLGVLLYELLTGTTPLQGKRFKEAALMEVLRIIREEEPPKPSTRLSATEELPSVAANRGLEPKKLSALVRGELDWIVMKALEKDRNRRYETANGLAHDLERYLHDEPVQASPPSTAYRLRKFLRRNRGPVLAVAVVLLALVVGIIGTTVGMERALRAKEAEAEQRRIAENNEKKAKEREAETKAVLDFVENKVFAAARPKDVDGGLGFDVKLADAIKAALAFVDKSFTGQPLIEARLRMTMASSFRYLGDAKSAIEQDEKARALYTEHRGPDHPDTLMSMNNLASSYDDAGRTGEGIKLHEETLQLRKGKLGPDHPDTVMSMNNLAASYHAARRTQEALKLFEETLPLLKAKLGPDHRYTLGCIVNLALCYAEIGRYMEAIKLCEETLQVLKAKMPDHPLTSTCMNILTMSYAAAGRTQEALKLNEETLQLRKAKLGPDHPKTLQSMSNLAWLLAVCPDPMFRDPKRAVELAKKAVQLEPENGGSWNTLGVAHFRNGDWKAAVEALNKSDELSKGSQLAFNAFILAMAHWQLGNHEQARTWYDRAVQWTEKHQPKNEELLRFRAEAEKLLGIEKPANPEPELVPRPKPSDER